MSERSYKEELFTVEHQDNLLETGELKTERVEVQEAESLEVSPAPLNNAEIRKNIIEAAPYDDETSLLEKIDSVLDDPESTPSTIVPETSLSISGPRELKKIQQHLPKPQQAFSKLIHQPVIRYTSETVGNTLSRPSGLLGGGLFAFLGSSSYFVMAKYIGFRYNYSLSLALFVGGFLIGLFLELLGHFARHRRAII